MPLLKIHHKTVYRYTHPVAFGEHRIMLSPRDSHDLRVVESGLRIEPQPVSLRWIHDVFGNSVAIAAFDERADTLAFISIFVLRHREPDLPRPYRVWGYPWTTLIVLVGSVAFLAGAIAGDTRNSFWALILLAVSYPTYLLLNRFSQRHGRAL